MAQCAGCHKTLTGSYQQALGNTWHPECFRCATCNKALRSEPFLVHKNRPIHLNCFVCAACKRPIGANPFQEEGGKVYHPACHLERFAKRCKGCSQPIAGTVITALGATWHEGCFRCAGCGQPMKQKKFLEKEGHPYHEPCYHQAFTPACDICHQPMVKGELRNAWGDRYCPAHTQLPACFSCNRPICNTLTHGGVRYRDGRTLCGLCSATAVNTLEQAEKQLILMQKKMAALGFPLGAVHIPFRLVDLTELKRHKSSGKDPMGLTRTNQVVRSDGVVLKRELVEVLVLQGLPQRQFQAVLAHELCHAYLFLENFPTLPSLVEEGLCTLAEYLYWSETDDLESQVRIQALETSDDPVYGKGFRQARKALKGRTVAQLTDHIRTSQAFPNSGFFARLFG